MKHFLSCLFINFLFVVGAFPIFSNEINKNLPTASKISTEDGFLFKEVTESSGIQYQGVSFGHAWSDIDLDGYPDLFCTGHGNASLYMNQKDGTFKTIKVPYFKKIDELGNIRYHDMHGVTFADVNHDGYPDVYIQIGGDMGHSEGKENVLFINHQGTIVFENKAAEYQMKDSLGRGRSTLFFDQNKDDYVDFFSTNISRNDGLFNSSLYSYQAGLEVFSRNQNLGLSDYSIRTSSMMQSRQKNIQQLINVTEVTDLVEVYDYSQVPFKKVYEKKLYGIRDVAIADFNGDAHQDLFLTANRYSSEVNLQDDTTMFIILNAKSNALGYDDENKISFKTDGQITIESSIYPYKDETKKYWRIGKNGRQPTSDIFTLHSSQPENHNFTPLCILCLGVNIGYNTTDNKWEIFNTDPIDNLQSAIKITSTKPFEDVQTYRFKNSDLLSADKLLINTGNGTFADIQGFLTNAENLSTGVSVVAADFDNDMDIDILISCQGSSVNYPNRYYENDGTGKFALKLDFGAEAATGGRSGSITTADFNNDGFLDVFVENGEGQVGDFSKPLHFNDGPYRLYQNKGNDNHWIKFHITDKESLGNQLAIGTVVNCYIKDKKQMRLKGSEHHAYAQNDPTIHFGTGSFTKADSVEIIWTNGDRSIFYEVDVDSMYSISGKDIKIGGEKPIVYDNCQEKVFPNPTNGEINLTQIDDSQKVISIEVLNYLGQRVYFKNVQDYIDTFSLSTNNWSIGMYIIKIFYQDKSACNSRFQLQR